LLLFIFLYISVLTYQFIFFFTTMLLVILVFINYFPYIF